MIDIEVKWLQPGERERAAEVLSLAMADNPASQAIWGSLNHRRRKTVALSYLWVYLQNPQAKTLAVWRGSQMVGVLTWFESPDCQISWTHTLKILPRMLRMPLGVMIRGLQFESACAQFDPIEPHWHLGPIGVLPDYQGQGIGSRMDQAVCDLLDKNRCHAFLETARPEVVTLQKRFGFEVVGEKEILGVNNWFMWRQAKPLKGE